MSVRGYETEIDAVKRALHAKIVLRAQMKGLLFALGEEKDFSIVKEQNEG